MQALYEKYKEKGFVVLGLSIDKANIDKVKEYIEDMKLTFPNLHDPTGKSALEYGVRGVPTTYFVDAEGKAIGMIVGPRAWDGEDVQRFVEQFLPTEDD